MWIQMANKLPHIFGVCQKQQVIQLGIFTLRETDNLDLD